MLEVAEAEGTIDLANGGKKVRKDRYDTRNGKEQILRPWFDRERYIVINR
jgi:hypothetical protein